MKLIFSEKKAWQWQGICRNESLWCRIVSEFRQMKESTFSWLPRFKFHFLTSYQGLLHFPSVTHFQVPQMINNVKGLVLMWIRNGLWNLYFPWVIQNHLGRNILFWFEDIWNCNMNVMTHIRSGNDEWFQAARTIQIPWFMSQVRKFVDWSTSSGPNFLNTFAD